MQLITQLFPYNLHFKKPATTSRGVYYHHQVWYVLVTSPDYPAFYGLGECAPLPDLSYEYSSNYPKYLLKACQQLSATGVINYQQLQLFPSISFGLETAMQQLEQQMASGKANFQLWQTPFSQGKATIPINGLIWMGDFESMQQQIEQKLAQGFRCIKLKVGATSFEQDLALLAKLRRHYSASEVSIRLDANGAFAPLEAQQKLQQLARYDIHSIEQPIAAKQWPAMAELIKTSPIAIVLDEELIGVFNNNHKKEMLEALNPHYIILKPSLHGGIKGCQAWIALAEQANVKWWFTSALESNIGLNAIAQFAATFTNPLPQGLGTGMLYHNNIALPLYIEDSQLSFKPTADLELESILATIKHNSYDV